MNKREIIERLKNIARHAVHTVGEEPFVMSLDDGIALHEAIELLKKPETNCLEIPNNSDTISRQAALDEFYQYPNVTWTTLDVMEKISELPSAQPEIIRCKDCKYYVSSGWCEGIGTCVSSDDFCSRAERREE